MENKRNVITILGAIALVIAFVYHALISLFEIPLTGMYSIISDAIMCTLSLLIIIAVILDLREMLEHANKIHND